MENKEKVYDEQIAPLMSQIIQICKDNDIPMFADFQYSDTDFCTSCIYPNVDGRHVVVSLYDLLSRCKTSEGINIDQFVFAISRKYKNTSSIVLHMLGNKPEPPKEDKP